MIRGEMIMTTTTIRTAMPLRDVLYEFSLAKPTPDAELLNEFVRRYPEHAAALTDFAVEIAIDAARGDDEMAAENIETTTVSPVVSHAMSNFQNHLSLLNRELPLDSLLVM
jgi:hypothetical protein